MLAKREAPRKEPSAAHTSTVVGSLPRSTWAFAPAPITPVTRFLSLCGLMRLCEGYAQIGVAHASQRIACA